MRNNLDNLARPPTRQASSAVNGGLRPLQQSLTISLLQAREAVMAHFRPQLLEHDLSEQQWRVIRALAEDGGIDAGTAAQRSCILPASFSRILRTLQQRGILRTQQSRTDSRRLMVELSPAGRELFERMAPVSEAIYRRLEARMGKTVINDAVRLAQRISEALRD